MRVVLDANVVVSGIFWAGPPFRVLRLWANDRIQALASAGILQEYAETLRTLGERQKKADLASLWAAFIFNHATLIDVHSRVDACRDPDDNKYLDCAIDGGAEYLVSGDRDLLDLKSFRDVAIVSPRTFLKICSPRD